MKAKEYFSKYESNLMSEEKNIRWTAAGDLGGELCNEALQLFKDRHAQRAGALAAIFKEQNQKFNAIVSMLEKKYGFSTLKRNGFIIFIKEAVPELRDLL